VKLMNEGKEAPVDRTAVYTIYELQLEDDEVHAVKVEVTAV
jgi:hypothetical protein